MENEPVTYETNDAEKKAKRRAIGFLVGLAVAGLGIGLLGFGAGYAVRGTGESSDSKQQAPAENANNQVVSPETDGVTVGGAKLVRSQDIIENVSNAKNLSSLTSFYKRAQLRDKLKLPGPYTVFAPTNDAFDKLPEGTLNVLTRPENQKMLAGALSYQIVAGTYTSADLKVMAQRGESLNTLQGLALTPIVDDNLLKLKDVRGTIAVLETADAVASNGIIHTLDGFLIPE